MAELGHAGALPDGDPPRTELRQQLLQCARRAEGEEGRAVVRGCAGAGERDGCLALGRLLMQEVRPLGCDWVFQQDEYVIWVPCELRITGRIWGEAYRSW